MPLFDTHCHLDVAAFDRDRQAVLNRSREAGVEELLVPAVTAAGWDGLLSLCSPGSGLYAALGLHPVFLERHRDGDLPALEQRVARDRPLAIGEIGLDFVVEGLDRRRQQALFEAQLGIARDADLPAVVHVRKAHNETIEALKRCRVAGGIVHAFNGSLQQAHIYLDLGFRLGFGGMLTFERSTRLRRLARQLPARALVLETDAPDLTVASHRGQRNSPEYLPEVLAALAEVRGRPAEELARLTTGNARDALNLT